MQIYNTIEELQESKQSSEGLFVFCRENYAFFIVQPSSYTLTGNDLSTQGKPVKFEFLVSGANIKGSSGSVQDDIDSIVSGGLPSQTGNSGKALTTDGASAEWSNVTLEFATAADIEALTLTNEGLVCVCQERGSARYVLAFDGYVAQPGDMVAANGRVWALQYSSDVKTRWLGISEGDSSSSLNDFIQSVSGYLSIDIQDMLLADTDVLLTKPWIEIYTTSGGGFITPDTVSDSYTPLRIRNSNIKISEITIDRNEANTGNNNGASVLFDNGSFSDIKNITFENVKFQNSKAYGVGAFAAGTLDNIRFKDCSFVNFTGEGRGCVQLVQPFCSNIFVDGQYVENSLGAGFAVRSNGTNSDPVYNVVVTNSIYNMNQKAGNTSIAIEVWGGKKTSFSNIEVTTARMGLSVISDGCTVNNCNFSDISSYCIEGKGSKWSINGNTFEDYTYGVAFNGQAINVNINDNVFESSKGTASNTGWALFMNNGQSHSDIVFSGNKVTNGVGVRITDTDSYSIAGNKFIHDDASLFLRVQADNNCDNGDISGNRFYTSLDTPSAFDGLIRFAHGSLTILDNIFISKTASNNIGSAVYLAESNTVDNVLVEGGYIENFARGVYTSAGANVTSNIHVGPIRFKNVGIYTQLEATDTRMVVREFSSSSAPTVGAWRLGDRVYNESPSAGGFEGWVCTTSGDFSGTAPTFKQFGVIQA